LLSLVACNYENGSTTSAGNTGGKNSIDNVEDISFTVDTVYRHSTKSFTQGLIAHEGIMYESTGLHGFRNQPPSGYGELDLHTGEIMVHNSLDGYFGEGITILDGKLYQLTYRRRLGFIYDLASKSRLRQFNLPTKEGWGITNDGKQLIISDGTSFLYFLDPGSLSQTRKVEVLDNYTPVQRLNELEYINGFVYANIYTTDVVIKIDPVTGKIKGRMNLSPLKR